MRIPASFFLAAILFLWPLARHPAWVPFSPGAQYSDLLISHLPNAQYVRDSLWQYGQWPLWNAQILAGQPFAADPLAGLWYPPNLLLLIEALPLPLHFNLLFAAHLAWAGYGLYRYLCARSLAALPAFFGGLAFAGTPRLIAHLGAGHVSLLYAVAWTPWLLLAVERAAARGGLRRGALVGACLALIFLADVRWAVYAGALAGAYWLARLPMAANPSAIHHPPRRASAGRSQLVALAGAIVLCLMLAAVLALPLAEFVRLSNRGVLTMDEAALYSLPPLYLLGLLIPDLGGFQEWMTYVGVIPLMLAPLGVRRRTLFWLLVILLAGSFALGLNFVLFPMLYRLVPGLALLRVPARAWFLVALGMCVLAGHGADRLVFNILPRLRQRYAANYQLTRMLADRAVLPVLLALTVLDLLRVDRTLLEARPLPDPPPAARWIAAQLPAPATARVYSPSYSLPQGDTLQHVDGVSPLQLSASIDLIERGIGVRAGAYSVTVPAFDSGDPGIANRDAAPDARLLGLLNVKYVAAEFPITLPEFTLAQTFGRTRVYHNSAFMPRAWVAGGSKEAEVRAWSPNSLEIAATGPGLLVLSEFLYPGWQATIDGRPAMIEPVEGVLRGVRLPPGPHVAVFAFRPATVYGGAALTVLGLLALSVILWRVR